MLLSAGLSVDNLVVGFSLGLHESSPLLVAATIAAFSMTFAALGMRLGSKGQHRWERRAAIGSGLLLIALAIASATGLLDKLAQ